MTVQRKRVFLIDNLLVRIHIVIVMMRWTGLTPWEFESPFSGSLTPTFLDVCECCLVRVGWCSRYSVDIVCPNTLLLIIHRVKYEFWVSLCATSVCVRHFPIVFETESRRRQSNRNNSKSLTFSSWEPRARQKVAKGVRHSSRLRSSRPFGPLPPVPKVFQPDGRWWHLQGGVQTQPPWGCIHGGRGGSDKGLALFKTNTNQVKRLPDFVDIVWFENCPVCTTVGSLPVVFLPTVVQTGQFTYRAVHTGQFSQGQWSVAGESPEAGR